MVAGKHAVIYARISSDRAGAGLGIGRQEDDCRALAARLGLTVVAVHADNDLSAYSGKPRPGYRKLLDAIQAGEVDAVLAWHTDRLHRSPRELEDYIDACEKHGVLTHTVTAGPLDLTTSTGKMVARMLGAVARGEVEHTIERMRAAHQQAATKGKFHGGERPFGWESDGRTPRPDEAAEIARAATLILKGVSLKSIAREWNERGITTARGRKWQGYDVSLVLRRARHAGLRTHRGEVIGKADWPAIIPEETWLALCARLDDPNRRTTPGPAPRWLGTGQFLCGALTGPGGTECGGLLTIGRGSRGGPGKDRIYRCQQPGRHVTRTAVLLDAYIKEVVVARMSLPDAIELATHQVAPAEDIGELQRQLVALQARKEEVVRLHMAGAYDERQAAVASTELQRLSKALEARIAAAVSISPAAGLAQAADPGAEWDRMTVAERKAAVAWLMTVTVLPAAPARPFGWKPGMSYFKPEYVRIDWREPH